ncbi:hypothetical protein [Allobaculum mucilyticum]|uniref:hypothetical protein n=1 Tax=Allobaculum mucilyticum TaxID=2834459 RepID=UPI001E3DA8C3|nr:hypothetical protein [Allobaculum mucilyticum]UNT96372.1 hypothetical protein KWG62_01000 [Allobaculum mucilyticum]
MSFKDMMRSFLFEDVEPDYDEHEQTEETTETVEKSPRPAEHGEPAPAEQPVRTAAQAPAAAIETPVQPVAKEEVHAAAPEAADESASQNSFFSQVGASIMGDEYFEEQPKKTSARSRRAIRKPVPERKRTASDGNSTYQPVLSPIFGNLPDDQKDHKKIHNAIELPEPTDGLDMVRVISPMFGNTTKQPRRPLVTPADSADAARTSAAPEKAESIAALKTSKGTEAAPEPAPAADRTEKAPAPHIVRKNSLKNEMLEEAATRARQGAQHAEEKQEKPAQKPMDLAGYLSRGVSTKESGEQK